MRSASALGVLVAVAVAVMPAAAHAQAPGTTQPVVPATGKLTLTVHSIDVAGALAGERFVVRGTLKPYVAGQRVTLRLYRHGRKIAARRLAVRPRHGTGRFEAGFASNAAGRVSVHASHRRTDLLDTAVARAVHVDVLSLQAPPGSRGLAVRVLQRRLTRLGYVVGRRGEFDARTARAVLAFRKVTGMPRTSVASSDVFRRLARGQGAFHVHYPAQGRHVEVDISLQVVALIDHGVARHVYPASSGAPATPTVRGTFHVYSKTPGYNAKLMYFASYFTGGYAIHGYSEVPAYNASHGCLRVPVPDAVAIYDWVRLGTPVDVYE